MSVRVRVAVALIVAAVVPLLGVFTLAGVLLPRLVGEEERMRLQETSTATASLLVRDCAAVGDQAALVASRLQAQVSVAEADVPLADALAGAAGRVVGNSVGRADPWSIVVLGPDQQVLAAGGPGAQAVADDPARYLGLSCRDGDLGSPPVLAVDLPVTIQEEPIGTVLAVSPLDGAAMDRLAASVGLQDSSLALLGTDEVLAVSSGFGREDSDAVATGGGDGSSALPSLGPEERRQVQGEAAELRERLVGEVGQPSAGTGDAAGPSRVGRVRDRTYTVAGPVLGAGDSGVQVVAVGDVRTAINPVLALSFVVTALGAAALVWLLSATLTRPLTELAELARRIASGEALGSSAATPADADADVKGVSAVLGSLARDLRASEADAQRRRGAFLDAFSRFGDALQQTHDRDGLLQTVLQAALLAAEAPMGLALHNDRSSRLGRQVLSLRARSRHDGPDGPDELDPATRVALQQVAERALAERAVIELAGTDHVGPVLAVPLGSTSRPLGAVVVARDVGEPGYDAVAFEAIGALATNAGTALGNIKDHQEVERLSVTDPLTGVNNFRHLTTMLARELERASRFGHPLGVLMLDIDRFKPVNDTYGHAAGDAVLRELARRIQECVREVDTVARYGGEEFALLLPETDVEGATKLAERVLHAIRSEVFRLPDGPDLVITASMGVAAFPDHGSTATDVMRSADDALYRAKTGGRDRVEVAGGAQVSSPVGSAGSPERDSSP